jgi:hypothetical protein
VSSVLSNLLQDKTELTDQKNQAYWERNQLLVLLAKFALVNNWPVGLGKELDGAYDQDYRNILFMSTPGGQASWHLHDSDVKMFDFLVNNQSYREEWEWDGHTFSGKYERLRNIALADLIFWILIRYR